MELGYHINPKENSFRELVQKFERDPTVGSKSMPILCHYSIMADQTSSSTEFWFHSNPKEKSFMKLVQIFEGDPTVGSKVMAILTRYTSLADQTSSSPCRDSISTIRKTALGNSGKTLSAIQWSDLKLWPFWFVTQVWLTIPPHRRLAITLKPYDNDLRKLVQKFEGDPTVKSKVMATLTYYSSLVEQTSSLPTCDSRSTPTKMAFGKSSKNLNAIQQSDRKFLPFWPVTQVWPTRTPRR
jgi:hypothetical protein